MRFECRIVGLTEAVHVIGRAVRVTHGSPECFPTIDALISDYRAAGVASVTPNKSEPVTRFGICSDHVRRGDLVDFTYMVGVRVREPVCACRLPAGAENRTVPAGDYACITVSAPDVGTALGVGYGNLEPWVAASAEWEISGDGIYEAYLDESPSEMVLEVWRPVRRRKARP